MINVYFDITDSSGNQLYTRIHISPFNTPLPYNGAVISSDAVLLRELTSPAFIELVPNSYEVKLLGRNVVSQFILTLPPSSDGTTVSASAFMASMPPYAGLTASYAVQAGSLVPNPANTFQMVDGQFQVWDSGFNQWAAIACVNGVLGVQEV